MYVCVSVGDLFARVHFCSTNLRYAFQYAHFNNFFVSFCLWFVICRFCLTNTSSLRRYLFVVSRLFAVKHCAHSFYYTLKFSHLYLNKNFLATSRKENKQKSTHT